MNRDVIRPLLLRPPVFGLPLVRAFSGVVLVMSLNDACDWNRIPGEVGLYLLVAIVFSLYRLLELDALDELGCLLPFLEPDVGLAPVALLADEAAHPFHLSADVEEADLFDFDLEELLDRVLD